VCASTAAGVLFAGAGTDAFAQAGGCGGVEGLDLVEHPGAFGDSGSAGDEQGPDGGEDSAAAGRCDALVGQHAFCCGERVDAIRLSGSAVTSPWTLDLDHGMPGLLQMLEESGAPAADALKPENQLVGLGERLCPVLQLGAADAGGRDRELREYLSNLLRQRRFASATARRVVRYDPPYPIATSTPCTTSALTSPRQRSTNASIFPANGSTSGRIRTRSGSPPPAASRAATSRATVL
jgi:hypothetical protein